MTQSRPRRTPAWDAVRNVFIVIAGGLTLFAAVTAAARLPWAVSEDPAHPLLPTPGNPWYAIAMCGAGVTAYAAHWWPRRARFWRSADRGIPSAVFSAIVWMTVTAGLLGISSFLPCGGDGLPVLSSVTRTLLLFVGEFDDSGMGPGVSGPCTGAIPLALQIARFIAIAVTFLSAVAVVFAVSRDQLARWRARTANDVDVVVGLDALSLPLVRALIAERDERRRAKPWYDLTVWERVKRRLTRPTQVIVLHPNRTDSIVDEAAEAGAVVIVGDPLDEHLLRSLLTHGRRPAGAPKSSLRRLFAVGEDQQANLKVVDRARSILAPDDDSLTLATSALDREVPRLVARLDDPREARDWGIANLVSDDVAYGAQTSGDDSRRTAQLFLDAVSVDDFVAEALCADLVETGIRSLVLAGDTALTVTLLDVLAWTAWTVAELRTEGASKGWPTAEMPRAWRLNEIILTGLNADRVYLEWEKRGAPCITIEGAPRITVSPGEWEIVAGDHISNHVLAAVVVTEKGASAMARATRLARLFPQTKVYAPDDTTTGLDAMCDGALIRFGPTLLQSGRVPEDSWTQLARFRHRHFPRDGSGRAARRRWDATPADEIHPAAPALPDFLREDNLRQHRQILRFVEAHSEWEWRPVTASEAGTRGAKAPVDPQLVLQLARAEHGRWVDLRLADGWRGIPDTEDEEVKRGKRRRKHEDSPLDRERKRRNTNLWDWDSGQLLGRPARLGPASVKNLETAREYDIEAIEHILDALYHWGIEPVAAAPAPGPHQGPEQVFERVGEVTAHQLAEPKQWVTTNGDTLRGEAGDWWVVSSDGTTRTVAVDVFPRMYELVAGSAYRRIGTVKAHQTRARTSVASLEGPSTALPGDWIVTDAAGNSWPVPTDVFAATYRPAAG